MCAFALPGENGTQEIGVEMNKNVKKLATISGILFGTQWVTSLFDLTFAEPIR